MLLDPTQEEVADYDWQPQWIESQMLYTVGRTWCRLPF